MIPYALVLLLLGARATTVAGAAVPSIDWAECKAKEVFCIVRPKCHRPRGIDDLMVYSAKADDPITTCDVGLTVRPFNTARWLVRMQVKPATPNLDPAKSIRLFAGPRVLFGCLLSNGTMTATGDPLLKTELYGADSSIAADGGYCTFLIKDASSLYTLNAEFKIAYVQAGQAAEAKTDGKTLLFSEVVNFMFCDPFSLTADYSTPIDGYNKAPIPDVLKEPHSCDGIPFAKLFVGREQATHFECKRAEKKYYFKRSKEALESALEEKQEVFCAISIGTTCKDLIHRSRNPPKYSQDPTSGQTSLKCDVPSHKMLINDEFYTDGAPECLSSHDSPNVGVWYARKENSADREEIHSALCTDQTSCEVISSFNATVPEGELYENAYLDNGNLSCENDAFLRVNQSSDKTVLKPSLITCDFTTGIYRMDNPDQVLDQGANVYCEFPPDASEAASAEAVAGAGAGTIVGIAGGAALLLLAGLIAGLFWFFLIRRRKKKRRQARSRRNHSSLGLPSSSSGPGNVKKRRRRRKIPSADTPYAELPDWVRRNLFYTGVEKMKNKKMKKIAMSSMMQFLDLAFDLDIDPTVWQSFLPFIFFVERDFFHISQTQNHTIVEREKVIPGFCYERLRLFLLDRADKWLGKWKYTRNEKAVIDKIRRNDKGERAVAKVKITKAELGGVGFIRGALLIMKYKLNIMNKEERGKIVNKVTDIFMSKSGGMDQVDASRFAIWGILHHEETGSKRSQGVHERFGYATGQRIMFDYLWDEFNKLLKQPLEPRPPYGSKMQHILFAMGCALEREPMAAVWKVMKEDKRFLAQDFMWAMYGRDWLWDGAWVCMFQNPPEHHLFCDRFSQECKAYKELAEMLTRYWPDKYSADAKAGYCFEGFMRKYDPKIEEYMLHQYYKWFERWERNRHKHGVDVNRWLLANDKREIAGYTPVDGDELVAKAKEGWEKRSDRQSIERLLQGGQSLAEQPTQPIEELPAPPAAAAAAAAPAAPAAAAPAAPAAAAAAVPAAPAAAAPAAPAAPPTAQPPSKMKTVEASGTGTGTGVSSQSSGGDKKK